MPSWKRSKLRRTAASKCGEFIPIEKVDPIYFESTYYLAPDKGADKPYRLLAETMAKTGRVALAQTVFHNKA